MWGRVKKNELLKKVEKKKVGRPKKEEKKLYRVSFNCDENLWKEFKDINENLLVNNSECVRNLIREYVKDHKNETN